MEIKRFDSTATAADIIDNGYFVCLNGGIVQGPATNQRIGKQITVKSIDLKLAVTQQNGALNGQQCRMMIVYDRQANGLAMNAPLLLDGGGAPNVNKLRNPDYMQRVLVLRDKRFTVNTLTQEESIVNINEYIKCNLPVQWGSGVAGTYADITMGQIWLCLFCQVPLGLINLKGTYTARVNYIDL